MSPAKSNNSRRSPASKTRLIRNRSASLSDSDSDSSVPLAARLLGPSGTKKSPAYKKNVPSAGYGNNKKRKPSSSLREDSSCGSEDSEEEEEDDNEDAIDEDGDQPETFAPSYGRKKSSGHKTGPKGGLSLLKNRKRFKIRHSGYDSSIENSSVSSASPLSSAESVDSADSDDGYEAVDDVSDADDEEQELEQLEEEMILDSEYERDLETVTTGVSTGIPDEWLGLDELENRPLYSTTGSFFEDEQLFLQSHNVDNIVEHDLSSATVDTPARRRVHFADSDDSSDSDKTSDDELLSDFLQQDSLDPDLRRMIENDTEPAHRQKQPQNEQLFVNQDFYELPGNIYHVETDTSVASSSGYESDGGETTDEDYPPPATITHPRSILRRDSSASLPPYFEDSPRRSQPPRRRGPLRGTFVADPHKPVAVVAPNGAQLILIPPFSTSRHEWLESATQSLCNTAQNSPRASNAALADDSDTDAMLSPLQTNLSPMLSSNANLMMTALGSDAVGQVMGPPEAFYPSQGPSENNSYDEDEEYDSEAVLDVNDFIDFGNGSSDEEDVDKDFDVEAITSPVVPQSIKETGVTEFSQVNSAERLLNHLDRGIVTAFRRNHSRYQALIRLPQHREFVPANSPSRPASVFRRTRFVDPKTPTRKRPAISYAGGEAVRRKLIDSHRNHKISF
ncbi:hypothetical protein FQN55_009531 [Onygenales sp. PD_40]|nr:hypothetical protein FQN55_009531 [Onygenales sp. PD_40]KAK2781172.1 hypothetical protein FQN52_001753 [Onygenales sp. PD_12]KAK2790048.1 hypothetical protein FQN53_000703 [Emmonsiellopsis sp. PD_33]KAK2797702.1 hypothetical protein FQN51_008280 [Onygenales sp. PD_10]